MKPWPLGCTLGGCFLGHSKTDEPEVGRGEREGESKFQASQLSVAIQIPTVLRDTLEGAA